ncbi:hypothetical protein E4U57_000648 [Claviceps arundinis]|uniref:Zn(2)-C6 fungal-type domain-containing protein n=1 Tax=Claviceps arundinis TaxID=1623583 RepID=A0ABQ7PM97_9HYPO|nr:hypothetical protein E4U57_000648 [Claviceps arundinis]
MAPDDLNTAQDAVLGVGLSPTSKDSSATPDIAPAHGPRPHPDTATAPGTADDPPSGASPVQNSTITAKASSPQPSPISISIESTERPAATATATATATEAPTSTATTNETATASATDTAPATVPAPAPASTANEIKPSITETSAAPVASPQSAVHTRPSASSSPATVAAPASPSQPQQNGDSKASDTDSEMASYRPAALQSHHGLSYSASPPSTTGSTNQHLAGAAHIPHPSSGMMDTQSFSYSTNAGTSHPNEGYRASPVPSSNPLSLPSMRTIDALSQRVSPPYGSHHPVPMSMSTGMNPAPTSPSYYPTPHTMPVPSNYSLPSDSLARFPLPHDSRILGSRGSKKEIKRRTKTGCLTCRKRRIKCDETHPTCNNCKKSKRECLGYDPIFRQQPGTQPASHIQPAPITSQLAVPSSVPSTVPSSSAIGHSPANSYGSQPSMLPGSYSTTPSPSALPPSSTTHTVTASNSYHSPVLANTTLTNHIESGPDYSAAAAKSESVFDLSGTIDRSNRHLPAPHVQDLAKPLDYNKDHHIMTTTGGDPGSKKMKITEIIDLLGPPPPPRQITHTEDTFNEITKVYHEMYAGGLSAFLETNWYYFVENGKMSFPQDANLVEHMATFLNILEAVKANDHSQMAYSGVLETRIVWELACVAYQTPDRTNQAMRMCMPPEGDATEARNRLRVVDTLLCGEYLEANPLAPPLPDADVHRTRQFDFWYSLAEFIRKRDNEDSPPAVQAREDALSRMRHLLDGRENRDVLYSIAVVRELAPSYGPSYGCTPQHLDESDPKNRLAVASKFILDEAQIMGGTTNVVRRFSDIASRAFVNPAVNVVRRTG